jgi:hypothetical protein
VGHDAGRAEERLLPPRPDSQLGGRCPRVPAAEAAAWLARGPDAPFVVLAPPGEPVDVGWLAPAALHAAAANASFPLAWVHGSGQLNQVESTERWRPALEGTARLIGLGLGFPEQALVRPPVAAVTMPHFLALMQQGTGVGDEYPYVYLNQKTMPSFLGRLLDAYPALGRPPRWAAALGHGSRGQRSVPHLWMGNGRVLTGVHTDQYPNVLAVHAGAPRLSDPWPQATVTSWTWCRPEVGDAVSPEREAAPGVSGGPGRPNGVQRDEWLRAGRYAPRVR